MANINIQSLGQVYDTGNGTRYKDLHLDLTFGVPAGTTYFITKASDDAIADYDMQAIKNSLLNMFNTNPGEKILNPAYGTGLQRFLFEAVSDENGTLIGNVIMASIKAYEPRIRVINVTVYKDIDNQQYVIDLNVTIPALKNSTATLGGTLSNSGFIFN